MHSQLEFVPRLRLSVLEGVRVHTGRDVVGVTGEAQRLLSFLALRDGAVPRSLVAGTLWPEVPESHSHSSLRSALARLERHIRAFITVEHTELGIAACVVVDLREGKALAHRLVDEQHAPGDGDLDTGTVALLSGDLLADRYEDWALTEAEEWRQLRLHALEALAGRLVVLERFGEAATAALAAIRVEPLRESARFALLRVHVGEGNQSEALREFARYAELLHDELGLEPTSRLRTLIDFSGRSARPGDLHVAPSQARPR
ncbi:MAG: family transcriptional regulator, regulator of embCAB operon [Actinomycetota bacterium]|jgi:DNA-binding SARP family transcriptional activator|nr:family transcriptional regulator, regulator of embCAB operon [Actinomycetota bacterium]